MTYWLDAFPNTVSPDLPPFDEFGNVPRGDYAPSEADFESRFLNIENSSLRVEIFRGWNRHRAALLRIGLPDSAMELLNGSFTTAKHSPGDIDIAVEVPVDQVEQMVHHPASRLLRGPEMKDDYNCDAYPIWSLPRDHRDHERVTADLVRYWTKWFGMDRNGRPKGRIWATVGGLR